MLNPLIEAIQDAVTPQITTVDGHEYISRSLKLPPAEPIPSSLSISTLSGLISYFENDPESVTGNYPLLIHVMSPTKVVLASAFSGRHAERSTLITADCSDCISNFRFEAYTPLESMIIGLQSQFKQTPDRDLILSVLGNLRDERVATYGDDGVTQAVTTRKGIALGEQTPVPRIVKLAPYRTFGEVEQPLSDFVLRLKQESEGKPPSAALFEAGGGAWRLEAIELIRSHLNTILNINALTPKQLDDGELNIAIVA
jgi:hypothetical protein